MCRLYFFFFKKKKRKEKKKLALQFAQLAASAFSESWLLFKWLDKNGKSEKLARKNEKGNGPVSLVRSFI